MPAELKRDESFVGALSLSMVSGKSCEDFYDLLLGTLKENRRRVDVEISKRREENGKIILIYAELNVYS